MGDRLVALGVDGGAALIDGAGRVVRFSCVAKVDTTYCVLWSRFYGVGGGVSVVARRQFYATSIR